jgi:hypothetical protein
MSSYRNKEIWHFLYLGMDLFLFSCSLPDPCRIVSLQAAEWNSSFSHPTRKIVVITSRLLSDAHRYILRCLSNHGTVSHCTVLTAISEVLRPYNNMLLVMPGLLLKFLTILLIIIIFMKLWLFIDKSILYVSTGTKVHFLEYSIKIHVGYHQIMLVAFHLLYLHFLISVCWWLG